MRCAKYFKSNQLAKYVENFSGKIFFLSKSRKNVETRYENRTKKKLCKFTVRIIFSLVLLSSHRASSPIRLEWLVMRIDVAHLYFVKKIDLNKDKKAGRKRNMHPQNNIGWDVEKDAKHQKLAKKETQIMFNSFQSINDPVLFFHIHFRMKSAWRKKIYLPN